MRNKKPRADYRSDPVTTDSPACIHSLRDTAINDKRIQYTFHSKGMQYICTYMDNELCRLTSCECLQHIRIILYIVMY